MLHTIQTGNGPLTILYGSYCCYSYDYDYKHCTDTERPTRQAKARLLG